MAITVVGVNQSPYRCSLMLHEKKSNSRLPFNFIWMRRKHSSGLRAVVFKIPFVPSQGTTSDVVTINMVAGSMSNRSHIFRVISLSSSVKSDTVRHHSRPKAGQPSGIYLSRG